MSMSLDEAKVKLIRLARKWQKDPLAFAQNAFPWGEGTLAGMKGPDEWQTRVLTAIRDQIRAGKSFDEVFRLAVASGNGIGKSCLVAWVCLWAISTMADTRGVVTANTDTQLRTKTFAELAKWFNLCVFRPWFDMSATSITSRQPGHEKTWRIDAVPWSESNPEAVAGMHNKGKRLLIIFDEASGIADSIWEAIEGAQTDKDTQIIWLCFGNPTRNTGRFYECFGKFRHRWIHWSVDSRTAIASNKEQIQQWVDDYGEDSDFVKVHVRGIFPSSSAMQFISRDLADQSAQRPLPHVDYTRMVAIIGVDVARFGDDQSVITTRFGLDARSIKRQKFRGLDGWQVAAKVAEHYNSLKQQGVRKIIINVDTGGVGASPVDWFKHNGYPCNAVNFGAGATDKDRYKNLRAEMWGRMRAWLEAGGCIEDDEDLISDLTGVEYDYTPTNQLLLEKKEDMKDRGLPSPDNADSLALTFAVKVNEYLDDLPSPKPTYRQDRHRTRDPYR